jgi:3',5'-nucleoside bisphosphate phosphatase
VVVPGAGGTGFVDLHAHSTASDGSRAPADVIAAAHAAGLAAIALTDHDTVDGIPEAAAAAASLGIRLVAGVELSAVEQDSETHILGLHLQDVGVLADRFVALRQMRLGRAEQIVVRLQALGVPVTMEAVLREAAGGAIGRPHVARAMVAGGWVRDFRDAFDRYLGNGRPACVGKDRLSAREAIAMIHEAGGLAVLAHPGPTGTRTALTRLRDEGMDGVEVRHPGHSPDDTARLLALAGELDLVPSGGSDWHGAGEGPRVLGAMQVPAEWLRLQDERRARRVLA